MPRSLLSRTFIALLIAVFAVSTAAADVKLAGVFGEHAVLQRDMPIPVWGWADPQEEVTVTLGDQTKTVKACEKGKWTVRLDPMKAGGPLVLKVKGKNTIEIPDVLVGEVWLCSGQSNMAMSVSGSRDFDAERAAANLPQIRMFTVARTPAETPQDNCQGTWVVSSAETVGGFSATAYFFGRELHKELGTPVGLINSSWGGTPVQAWTCLKCQQSESALKPLLDDWQKRIESYDPAKAEEAYKKQLAAWEEAVKKAKEAGKDRPRKPQAPADPKTSPHRPANLFNGMIAPLAPYAIRGAIWYQGESNAGRYDSTLYGMQLALMIQNWRKVWGQGDFAFEWVQLPNFRAPQQKPSETTGWVVVQNEMLKTLRIPNTGMAITIDVGDEKDIHPKNKQDVGKRLALWALSATYGKDNVRSGPIYKGMTAKDGAIVVSFDHVGGGLVAKGDAVKGFAIAGEDKKFVAANAKIDGPSVVVSSPEVKCPVAVRYAWAENPDCNLYNKEGLPASPFRTDDWPLADELQ